MAIFNEILAGRYPRFIQRLFSMKGPQATPQVSGEVIPILGLFNGAENRFLEGWNKFGITNNPAAGGVGNANHFQIRNPSGSAVVAVIEKISFGAVGAVDAGVLSQGPSSTDLNVAFGLATSRMDARSNTNSILIASTQPTAPTDLAGLRAEQQALASGETDFILTGNQEIPLLPGDALRIRQIATNQSVIFTLWWRERALEDSELKT